MADGSFVLGAFSITVIGNHHARPQHMACGIKFGQLFTIVDAGAFG